MRYTPDRWVVMTIKTDTETVDKLFAGWLDKSWRLSSRIADIEFDGEQVIFTTDSGSVYYCNKKFQGFTSRMHSVLETWLTETDCEIVIHDRI